LALASAFERTAAKHPRYSMHEGALDLAAQFNFLYKKHSSEYRKNIAFIVLPYGSLKSFSLIGSVMLSGRSMVANIASQVYYLIAIAFLALAFTIGTSDKRFSDEF